MIKDYSNYYKKYLIKKEKYYYINDSVIFLWDWYKNKGIHKIYNNCDMIWIDPPLNKSSVNSFYNKNREDYKINNFEEYLIILIKIIENIKPKICYIIIGKEYIDFIEYKISKIYIKIEKYDIFYNKNKKCFLLIGYDNRKIKYNYTNLDQSLICRIALSIENYKCVGDFCMGKGRVAYNAMINCKRFIGSDINPRRLAWILHYAVDEFKLDYIQTNKII